MRYLYSGHDIMPFELRYLNCTGGYSSEPPSHFAVTSAGTTSNMSGSTKPRWVGRLQPARIFLTRCRPYSGRLSGSHLSPKPARVIVNFRLFSTWNFIQFHKKFSSILRKFWEIRSWRRALGQRKENIMITQEIKQTAVFLILAATSAPIYPLTTLQMVNLS